MSRQVTRARSSRQTARGARQALAILLAAPLLFVHFAAANAGEHRRTIANSWMWKRTAILHSLGQGLDAPAALAHEYWGFVANLSQLSDRIAPPTRAQRRAKKGWKPVRRVGRKRARKPRTYTKSQLKRKPRLRIRIRKKRRDDRLQKHLRPPVIGNPWYESL